MAVVTIQRIVDAEMLRKGPLYSCEVQSSSEGGSHDTKIRCRITQTNKIVNSQSPEMPLHF